MDMPHGRTPLDVEVSLMELRETKEPTEEGGDDLFERLVRSFPPVELRTAARCHLEDLRGPDGEMALRLIEAFGDEGDREALAHALQTQPDLRLDRAWQALSLLEAAGHLEDYPDLAERWAEFDDLGEAEDLLGELAEVIGGDAAAGTDLALVATGPCLRACVATAVDEEGRGQVALAAQDGANHLGAIFDCDVTAGITGVSAIGATQAEIDAALNAMAGRPVPDAVADRPDLALSLLAGCLGVGAAEGVRGWLDRLIGPGFGPVPMLGWSEGDASAVGPGRDLLDVADAVLDAAGWVDGSALTVELAEEIKLREGDVPPDPARDAGAFRFLFEHRLLGRVELYRRSLLWMAAFWSAAGSTELSRGALALALDLDDAQNAVPGQAFFVRLIARSLSAAIEALRVVK